MPKTNRKRVKSMTSTQMYELAKNAVIEHEHVSPEDPVQPDVLWVGGILEIRRGVVWYGEKLFMVTYNMVTEETTVDTYLKTEG